MQQDTQREAERDSARDFTTMIAGRWGKPSEVLLDLVVEGDGSIRGVANPGRQNAPIRRGHFDAISGVLNLEGEHVGPDGTRRMDTRASLGVRS